MLPSLLLILLFGGALANVTEFKNPELDFPELAGKPLDIMKLLNENIADILIYGLIQNAKNQTFEFGEAQNSIPRLANLSIDNVDVFWPFLFTTVFNNLKNQIIVDYWTSFENSTNLTLKYDDNFKSSFILFGKKQNITLDGETDDYALYLGCLQNLPEYIKDKVKVEAFDVEIMKKYIINRFGGFRPMFLTSLRLPMPVDQEKFEKSYRAMTKHSVQYQGIILNKMEDVIHDYYKKENVTMAEYKLKDNCYLRRYRADIDF
ncbi:unnamed protein product [Bursaphelenchus okinawaensis]|uniref:Uncharacterized protein n=1 Tax=Bursaphelenchus okinawaensis TaxID=465554 RepID=A0A811L915_9BILA|nr:unnamed protein product [Bursaphelenchus okinawaensis]CAG9118765.1 unnamed protein product [Bursaphelenchus okinawaensis]